MSIEITEENNSVSIAENVQPVTVQEQVNPVTVEEQANPVTVEQTNNVVEIIKSGVGEINLTAIIDVVEAGEDITATNVVYRDSTGKLYKADSSNDDHADLIFGVAIQTVSDGSNCRVLVYGELVDTSFTFTTGTPLYLNGVGSLSATPPTTGFSILVGKQYGTNSFFLDKQVPIFLL